MEFWKQHQKDSLDGLALAFLREGSEQQKSEAADLLAASSDPAVLKVFETYVLEDASPAANLTIVRAYLRHRNSAAKPFLDRYVKALREELGDGTDLENRNELPYEIQQLKSIEPLIKQLQGQVSGKSPQARAKEIAKDDPKTAITAIPSFVESLSDATPHTIILALLAGAVAAEDAKVRETFIGQIGGSGRYSDEQEATPTAGDRTLPPGEAEAWKTLLADERPSTNIRNAAADPSHQVTLAGLAAEALEFSINPTVSESFGLATSVTGKTSEELALPRAMARLNGEPIPALPDAKKVLPERLKEIIATVASKAPLEIHPYLKTLSDDERAAWLTWYQNPGDIPIPDSAMKLAAVVTERAKHSWQFPDMPNLGGIAVGFEVNEASLKTSIEQMAGNLAEKSRSIQVMSRSSFPPGLNVLVTKVELSKKAIAEDEAEDDSWAASSNLPERFFQNVMSVLDSAKSRPEVSGAILLSLSGRRTNINKSWLVIDGKAVPNETGETSEDLAATLTKVFADQNSFYLQIQTLSRADADAISKPE